MRIFQLILTHINILSSYVTMILIILEMGVKNEGILYNNAARNIFLIFYDYQYAKPESFEIEMSISQLIITNINTSKGWCDNDIHTINMEKNVGLILHITVVVAIFLLWHDDFMMTKTLNQSN